MSEFARGLHNVCDKIEGLTQEIFVAAVAEVKTSIVEGSAITGAPGQPVGGSKAESALKKGDTLPGVNLRGSWQLQFESPTVAVVGTKVLYAESNEDGIARPGGGPYIKRSALGGRWSVALTRAGWPKIVEAVRARLAQ